MALAGSTSEPGTDYRLPGKSIAPSPQAPGVRTAYGPREAGPLVESVVSTCSSPPAPVMRTTPGPREDDDLVKPVGSTSPASGVCTALGLREDNRP